MLHLMTFFKNSNTTRRFSHFICSFNHLHLASSWSWCSESGVYPRNTRRQEYIPYMVFFFLPAVFCRHLHTRIQCIASPPASMLKIWGGNLHGYGRRACPETVRRQYPRIPTRFRTWSRAAIVVFQTLQIWEVCNPQYFVLDL